MDVLGAVTYYVCGNGSVGLKQFREIMGFNTKALSLKSRSISKKLFTLANVHDKSTLDVNNVMDFLLALSAPM